MAFVRELAGASYPPRLRDLRTPPRVWITGELPRGLSVAIVGTRSCSEEARAFARRLARELAQEGVVILSGGAKGIDTAAHEGALDVGGATVVVAPSSFDRPYPEENAPLFDRVVREGGAFLSLFDKDESAFEGRFLQRNWVLAAMAEAVVVVQTRVRGGSRHAAACARKLGRQLLIVPGAPWEGLGLGCVVELRLGGKPVGSFRDVMKAIGRPVRSRPKAPPGDCRAPPQVADCIEEGALEPDVAALRQALISSPGDVDDLHSRTGIPVGRLRGLLLTLTLDGVLVSTPAGQLSLAK